jgi:hypothetical protein
VFKKLTPRQRLEKMEEKQLCKLCFRHLAINDCWAKGKIPSCHIKGCGGEHNHLLHDALVLGRALVIQEVGGDSGQSYSCREDIRAEVAGKTYHLRTLHDWGATQTLITHDAAHRAGLTPIRHSARLVSGLGSECLESTCFYVVPFVDGSDEIQTLRATGVARITSFGASAPPSDIEERYPLARGLAARLARPAKEADLLVGLDNQRWMPRHVSSSLMKGDNLRLMQWVLGPACMLMGRAMRAAPDERNQGSAGAPGASAHSAREVPMRASPDRQSEWRVRSPADPRMGCLRKMMAVVVLLAVGATRATAFKAFDCNNGSAPIEQYSLLDLEPCGDMQKVHAIERDLHGEIVQTKKEGLVQVTKCVVFETITSMFCGFQSRAGVPRYVKFWTPLTIEPSDCRLSAKLGKIRISGKEHPFEKGVKTDFSVYLVGGLDAQGNCEVGAYEVNGEMVTGQVVKASYEVDIKQEWARANDLTGAIKLSESLIATTTDRATVDSGEGTYVWDFSQDACPDTLVSLCSGPIKVLTNSSTTFTDWTAIVSGRDKDQVAGLELKETMVLCYATHIKNIAVFFHPMEQIQVALGRFSMVTEEAEFTRLESELSFLQVKSTMSLQ